MTSSSTTVSVSIPGDIRILFDGVRVRMPTGPLFSKSVTTSESQKPDEFGLYCGDGLAVSRQNLWSLFMFDGCNADSVDIMLDHDATETLLTSWAAQQLGLEPRGAHLKRPNLERGWLLCSPHGLAILSDRAHTRIRIPSALAVAEGSDENRLLVLGYIVMQLLHGDDRAELWLHNYKVNKRQNIGRKTFTRGPGVA